MEAKIGDIVLPGQRVKDQSLEEANSKSKIILGPGLKRVADHIYICKAGVLKKTCNSLYVYGHQKKYIPARDETVVGVITKKMGDLYRVDIGAAEHALINYLSFEGSTKKLRPNIDVGDLIFAKLLMACPDMEPELVCVDSFGKKGRLGILPPGGYLIACSLHLVRKLLTPRCKLLKKLGESLTFEIVVGMNGRVWLKGTDPVTTITVGDAILSAEVMDLQEIDQHCSKLIKHFGVRKK